ncbi:uncharacterized protein LOC129584023 [Paramacrobiotus metropolitanus]|uniref:uncharacterized protein LOC129584023 n=1 Tax=Paramacrobiotus metropolitanus TaxID=2943436 RepID=UPI002445A02E|nr:uncharacterized protein LOC129584023 [Paramacrobiotus metropolitanus]
MEHDRNNKFEFTSLKKLVVIAAVQSLMAILYLAYTTLVIFYVLPTIADYKILSFITTSPTSTNFLLGFYILITGILGMHAVRIGRSVTLFIAVTVLNFGLGITLGWALLVTLAIINGVGEHFGFSGYEACRITWLSSVPAILHAVTMVAVILCFFLMTCAAASIGVVNARSVGQGHIRVAVEEMLARRNMNMVDIEGAIYAQPEGDGKVINGIPPPSYSQFL